MQQPPSREQKQQHAHCVTLRVGPGSGAFAFYLDELSKAAHGEHREVCAEAPRGSREFHAGRLSAFTEAAQLIEKKYATLKPIVEVLPS